MREAARLGPDALVILDVDGMYSTVQAAVAARSCGLPIVYGAELTLDPAVPPDRRPRGGPGARGSGSGDANRSPGFRSYGIRARPLMRAPRPPGGGRPPPRSWAHRALREDGKVPLGLHTLPEDDPSCTTC